MADVLAGTVSKCDIKMSNQGKQFTKFTITERIKTKDKSSDLIPAQYENEYYDCVQWFPNTELKDDHKVIAYGQKGSREWEGKTYKTFEIFHLEIVGKADFKRSTNGGNDKFHKVTDVQTDRYVKQSKEDVPF